VRNAARAPVTVTYQLYGEERKAEIGYRGTLRYPHLSRIDGVPDRLMPLLAAR
jgi:hypothetical protein